MEAPNNLEWGPALWMILHSAAERIGTKPSKRLPQEEGRLWTHLLHSLRLTLPCPACKRHYGEYIARSPLITTREGVRRWLYTLHEHVNTRLGKSSDVTIENVAAQYEQPFHFTKHEAVVTAHMMRALRRGWIAREDMIKTIRLMEEMRRFYDFF